MADGIDWSLCRSVLAVMEAGSLSRAAHSLGLSQPTVGRQVAALEGQLGVALFTRSPSGLMPTPAARALRPHLEAMMAAATALQRSASGAADAAAGVVRITASQVIGGAVLPDILAAFRAAHPAVAVELALSNQNQDLLRREADVAVRMARPTQAALHARRIGTVEVGLHATGDYLETHGAPADLSDRAGHTVIGWDTAPVRVGGQPLDLPAGRDAFDVRCDSDLACLAMVRAGVGIGACQIPLARRWGLVPVLPDAFRLPLEVWVVTHEDLKAERRIRLMFDALVAGLTDYVRAS